MRVVLVAILLSIFAIADTIKIATYNVENLFDGKNNGNEYKDFKTDWNEQKYNQKLANIKSVIMAVNADIIALQEIENEQILKELVRDTEYKFISFRITKNAPIGLGLISKIKPKNSEYFSVPSIKTRDILKVNFNGFSVYINHFPAYKKNGKEAQEKAERTLRVALENEKNSIVLGDFNTPYGKNSLLNTIQTTKNYTNLWEFLKPSERYSFAGYGKKRAIDHVLLSPSFMDKSGEYVYVCGSFVVFKDELTNEKGYAKSENGLNVYSDHFPLVFEISTDKSKACGLLDRIF